MPHLSREMTVGKILRRTDGSGCSIGKVLLLKLKKAHEINFLAILCRKMD